MVQLALLCECTCGGKKKVADDKKHCRASPRFRGVNGMWAEWAIAHSDFGRIEGAAGRRRRVELLLAHPVLDRYLRP